MLIFDAQSTEHEVSLQSARNIVDAIDQKGIGHLNESTHFMNVNTIRFYSTAFKHKLNDVALIYI